MGFAQGVINSLNYTRSLLKKKSPFFDKSKLLNSKGRDLSKPRRQLSRLRLEHATYKKKQSVLLFLFGVVLFSVALIYIVPMYSPKTIDFKKFTSYQPRINKATVLKHKYSLNSDVFINSGNRNLALNKYAEAQLDFHTVLTLNRYNYEANFGMSKALAYRCALEDYNCELAKEYIQFTMSISPHNHAELDELMGMIGVGNKI